MRLAGMILVFSAAMLLAWWVWVTIDENEREVASCRKDVESNGMTRATSARLCGGVYHQTRP